MSEDKFKYTAADLVRFPVVPNGSTAPQIVQTEAKYLEDPEPRVAEIIISTCAVGYGGHYGEVLEDHREGEIMDALADWLGPLHKMTPHEALVLLNDFRDEWSRRQVKARDEAAAAWKRQSWIIDRGKNPDRCPLCGKEIDDQDDEGCEDDDGQRWCIHHALEALAVYRRTAE